jgi:hypothetical protein
VDRKFQPRPGYGDRAHRRQRNQGSEHDAENFQNAHSVIVWIVSMLLGNGDVPHPWGGRGLSATVIVLATAATIGWSATHTSGACGCGPPISFGRVQPGFRHLGGAVSAALGRLPVRVRLASAIGPPIGVYRSSGRALVLYGERSPGGVFRFTAAREPRGFGQHALRDLSRECSVCSDNRRVALAPGIGGALMAGGNGPNSITWLEHGLEMQVLGPPSTFSAVRAIAVARALAGANRT